MSVYFRFSRDERRIIFDKYLGQAKLLGDEQAWIDFALDQAGDPVWDAVQRIRGRRQARPDADTLDGLFHAVLGDQGLFGDGAPFDDVQFDGMPSEWEP